MKVFIYSVLLFVCFNFPVNSAEPIGDNVKHFIIERCRKDVSEFGAALVKSCVDQDIQAVISLNTYPAKHKAVMDRCMRQMSGYGFVLVKSCVDQDIAAEAALADY